jgi:hypothetical protein
MDCGYVFGRSPPKNFEQRLTKLCELLTSIGEGCAQKICLREPESPLHFCHNKRQRKKVRGRARQQDEVSSTISALQKVGNSFIAKIMVSSDRGD